MAEQKFTVPLQKMIDEFKLEIIYVPKDPNEILIDENDVNRPGLQLQDFYEYFNPNRIQIIGKMEFAYLSTLDDKLRDERLEKLFAQKVSALVIARELPCFPSMIEFAKKYEVPLLRTNESTSPFIASLIAFLNLNLAPRITRHGVLIEIYGEGVLILGESGVGKSETAIELVKRGHRLVADDAVEIRRVSNISLVGSSPDNIRHFLEQLCLLQCVLSRCGIQHQIYLSVCRRIFSLDDTRNLLQFLHQVFLVVQTPCRIAD